MSDQINARGTVVGLVPLLERTPYRNKKDSTADMFVGFDEGLALIKDKAAAEIEMFGYTLEGASRLPQSV